MSLYHVYVQYGTHWNVIVDDLLLEMEDKGRLQEVDLSSSYEAAMEALSSLISRQKRGTEPKKAGKFGLMFKYLQVMIAQTCIN